MQVLHEYIYLRRSFECFILYDYVDLLEYLQFAVKIMVFFSFLFVLLHTVPYAEF